MARTAPLCARPTQTHAQIIPNHHNNNKHETNNTTFCGRRTECKASNDRKGITAGSTSHPIKKIIRWVGKRIKHFQLQSPDKNHTQTPDSSDQRQVLSTLGEQDSRSKHRTAPNKRPTIAVQLFAGNSFGFSQKFPCPSSATKTSQFYQQKIRVVRCQSKTPRLCLC